MSSSSNAPNFRGSDKPLDVVIVGGSVTGLMLGVILRRHSHNVHILERSTHSAREGQAAGLGLGMNVQRFLATYDLTGKPSSVTNLKIRVMDRNFCHKLTANFQLELSSWDVLYYRLRANFDGLVSGFCEAAPARPDNEGKGVYDIGKKVVGIEYDENGGPVKVRYKDVMNEGREGFLEADFVIGADGTNSTVRSIVCPEMKRNYSGYVGWRGTIPEKDVSEETMRRIGQDCIITWMDLTYVILYIMPGENGTLQPGDRLVNLVWYTNISDTSHDYIDAMTDVDGHRHSFTLPKGKMNPEVWAKRKAIARQIPMPPQLLELIDKIEHPFISTVSDNVALKARFCDGKVVLVGDALSLIRPNTGSGANKGAFDCIQMAEVVEGRLSWEEWERKVLENAHVERLYSINIGNWFLGGTVAWIGSAVRYRAAQLRRWISSVL